MATHDLHFPNPDHSGGYKIGVDDFS
jgi:hypothetical protein